jgi:hypothetical protein
LGGERADIGLDDVRRHAGGAGGAVQARADQPPGCAAGVASTAIGDAAQHQPPVHPLDDDLEREAGAEGEPLQRARVTHLRAPAEPQVEHRAGRQLGQRHHAARPSAPPAPPRPAPRPARVRRPGQIAGGGEVDAQVDDRAFGALTSDWTASVGAIRGRCGCQRDGDTAGARFFILVSVSGAGTGARRVTSGQNGSRA